MRHKELKLSAKHNDFMTRTESTRMRSRINTRGKTQGHAEPNISNQPRFQIRSNNEAVFHGVQQYATIQKKSNQKGMIAQSSLLLEVMQILLRTLARGVMSRESSADL